jgi:hypothetical protein
MGQSGRRSPKRILKTTRGMGSRYIPPARRRGMFSNGLADHRDLAAHLFSNASRAAMAPRRHRRPCVHRPRSFDDLVVGAARDVAQALPDQMHHAGLYGSWGHADLERWSRFLAAGLWDRRTRCFIQNLAPSLSWNHIPSTSGSPLHRDLLGEVAGGWRSRSGCRGRHGSSARSARDGSSFAATCGRDTAALSSPPCRRRPSRRYGRDRRPRRRSR